MKQNIVNVEFFQTSYKLIIFIQKKNCLPKKIPIFYLVRNVTHGILILMSYTLENDEVTAISICVAHVVYGSTYHFFVRCLSS